MKLKFSVYALTTTALMLSTISGSAVADTIHCGGGYSIIRNVTGTKPSDHMSYDLDTGTIQLRQYGKPLFTGRVEDVELAAYNTSGTSVLNYEFDINKKIFDIFVIDNSQIGSEGASDSAYKLVTLDGNYTCVMGE